MLHIKELKPFNIFYGGQLMPQQDSYPLFSEQGRPIQATFRDTTTDGFGVFSISSQRTAGFFVIEYRTTQPASG